MRLASPINWIQWLTLLLLPVFAIPITILFHEIRNVQHHQNDALRSIICFAEFRSRTSPILTAKQKQGGLRFYNEALRRAHLDACQL